MRAWLWLAAWFPITASASSTCPDPSGPIASAEQALVDLRIAALPAIQEELVSAWACGPVARPEDLSRAWLIGAAYLRLQGQQDAADQAWRAAAHISPDTWNSRLGEGLRAEYLAAQQLPQSPRGNLSLSEDLPRKLQFYLDGAPRFLPLSAPPGPHLVQTIDRRGQAQAAHLIQLAPDESLVLDLGHFSTAPGRQRAHWRLVAAGTAAGLATGSALLALSQDSMMRQAETQSALDAAYARQKRLALTSYGLGGLSIAGVTTWVFF